MIFLDEDINNVESALDAIKRELKEGLGLESRGLEFEEDVFIMAFDKCIKYTLLSEGFAFF